MPSHEGNWFTQRERLKKEILKRLEDGNARSPEELARALERLVVNPREGEHLVQAALNSLQSRQQIVRVEGKYALPHSKAVRAYAEQQRHMEEERRLKAEERERRAAAVLASVKAILRERQVVSKRDLIAQVDAEPIEDGSIERDGEVSRFQVHHWLMGPVNPDFTFYCLRGQEKSARRKALKQVRSLVFLLDGCQTHQRRFVQQWVYDPENQTIDLRRVCPLCDADWILQRKGGRVPPGYFTLRQLGLHCPPEGARPAGFISHHRLLPRAVYSVEDPVIRDIVQKKEDRLKAREARRKAYHPTLDIDRVCLAIYTMNKAAKRMKQSSQQYYFHQLHGFAQFSKGKKEAFYKLKDHALEKLKELRLYDGISFHQKTEEYDTWEEIEVEEDDWDDSDDSDDSDDWDDDGELDFYPFRQSTQSTQTYRERVRSERTVYLEYITVKGAKRSYGFHHHPTVKPPEGVTIDLTLPSEFSWPVDRYPLQIWQAETIIQQFLQEGLPTA